MAGFIKAVNSGGSFVVELSPRLFALVNEECYLFARNPDSFYKQGYFKEPDSPITSKRIREIIEAIGNKADSITPENRCECCLGDITEEEIKQAYDAIIKRASKK